MIYRAQYDLELYGIEWLYLDHRLRNRRTYIEWDKEMLGPIRDTMGVEQGGCASDRVYRLVNNEQLQTAQESQLGVDLGLAVNYNGDLVRQVLSAVGRRCRPRWSWP